MRNADRFSDLIPPPMTEREMEMTRIAQRSIMEAVDHSRILSIAVTTDEGEHPVALPPAALKLIGQLLGAIGEGRPLRLVPAERELTTVEAAHFLNVSRPFVIKEINEGKLPHRMVGTHRRIALTDLVVYASKMSVRQSAALDRMADNARELGLDY